MKEVVLLGMGMGNANTLTLEGKQAIDHAQVIIGAKRFVEGMKIELPSFISIDSQKIAAFIKESDYSRFVVLFSGDTGFYSGANSLSPLLQEYTLTILPGISSLSYFSAMLGISWEDAYILSVHGRNQNIAKAVSEHKKTFLLTQGNVSQVCVQLQQAGLEQVDIYIGENLSYSEEKITKGHPADFINRDFSSLSVLFILNENPSRTYRIGMREEEFIRSKVPMTKSEVRAISISKLYIKENAIIYDIGAGTGSITVEAALLANQGRVYAIEEKSEAVELIQANVDKFRLDNVVVCHGSAPECIHSLETPDICFIGGSRGNLVGIVETLLLKNSKIRIVINAITLETLMEALEVFKKYSFEEVEMVQVSIAKTKEVADYHMLMAQNPIYIISGRGR